MGPRHYFLDHFMRPSKFLAATALTALASLANAETFNFMYTFMDQAAHTVKGSFDGVRDGEWGTGFRVTQLTNVSVEVGAYKFADDHWSIGHSRDTGGRFQLGDAVASEYGNANNLIFLGYDKYGRADVFHSNSVFVKEGQTGYKFRSGAPGASEHTVAAHWHLSPAPEPETYAMLLAGLGLIGSVARRRKSRQV